MKLITKLTLTIIMVLNFIPTSVEAVQTKSPLAIRFFSAIDDQSQFDTLKAHPLFVGLNDDNTPGSPVSIVISYRQQSTDASAAAEFASGVLAGSTLGILPVVMNNDMIVRYELFVQGNSIYSTEFLENFTDAKNMYAMNQGLDAKVKEWIVSTTPEFLKRLEQDGSLEQTISEYNYYFN